MPDLWISYAFRYWVNYWPKGRRGERKKIILTDNVRSAEAARKLERSIMAAHKPAIDTSSTFSTVADLFPDYLKWYKLRRATTTFRDITQTWENSLHQTLHFTW